MLSYSHRLSCGEKVKIALNSGHYKLLGNVKVI